MADSYEHLKADFDRIAAENRSQHKLRLWTLDNIYTIARRRLNALDSNRQDVDALVASERAAWGHIYRLCEQVGCQGRGVLRDNGGAVGEHNFGPEKGRR